MSDFACRRCGATEGKFEKTPYPGPLSDLILGNVCQSCWRDWFDASLIMLNEYRLNLLDPKHAEMYDQQMLAFLNLLDPEQSPHFNLEARSPLEP